MVAFIHGTVPERIERLVTATPAQFERDLRAVWPAVSGSAAKGMLSIEAGGLRLDIGLEAVGVRRIGLFELPQLCVRYCFSGADESARRTLLTALDRGMQKGGG